MVESAPLPGSAVLTEPAAATLLPNEPLSLNPATTNEPAMSLEPTDGSVGTPLPPWKFNFGTTLRVLHDDNIFIKPTNEVQDWIYEVLPYLELAWGDYRDHIGNYSSLRYTADARHYEDNDFLDKVDHDAEFALQLRLKKTLLNFGAEYKSLSTIDIDFGNRTERQIFAGTFNAEYELNGKTSLELDLFGTFTDYDSGLDSQNVYSNLWFNTLVTPKFRLSVGGTAGYLKQQGSSSQDYLQFVLRGRYLTTEKTTIRGQVGFEYREFDSQEKYNVLGKFGIAYKPRENTELSLDFNRNIIASASAAGRNYVSTGFVGRARQRLFQKLDLSLAAGYSNADYQQASFEAGQERTDNIFFVSPEISVNVREWMRAAIFYTFRQNDSSREDISFESNVIGFELSAQF